MEKDLFNLVERILDVSAANQPKQAIIGIAGPPGSGKSTVATDLAFRLRQRSKHSAGSVAAISLDGFHLRRSQLRSMPDAEAAFARRGAPWTSDVLALKDFVSRLRDNADLPLVRRKAITAPTFDHKVKDPVADGIIVHPEVEIIILEHVYLLLDETGWRDIAGALDLKVMIDVDNHTCRERVAQRHVHAGIEATLDLARQRYDSNDGLNGERVRHCVVHYDILLRSVDVHSGVDSPLGIP